MQNIVQKSITFFFALIVFAIGGFCQEQNKNFPKESYDTLIEGISKHHQKALPEDLCENIIENMPSELPEPLEKHIKKLKEVFYEWGKEYNLTPSESRVIIQIALGIKDLSIIKTCNLGPIEEKLQNNPRFSREKILSSAIARSCKADIQKIKQDMCIWLFSDEGLRFLHKISGLKEEL